MKNENKQRYNVKNLGSFYIIQNPQNDCDNYENIAEIIKILESLQQLGICKQFNAIDAIKHANEWWIMPNKIRYYDNLRQVFTRVLGLFRMMAPNVWELLEIVENAALLIDWVNFTDDNKDLNDRTTPAIDFDRFNLYYEADEKGREILRALWG